MNIKHASIWQERENSDLFRGIFQLSTDRRIHRGVLETGRPCRILMDLAGEKLRTGTIVAGPAVRRLKVRRDDYGAIVEPATVLIAPTHRRAKYMRLRVTLSSETGLPLYFCRLKLIGYASGNP